MITTNLFCYLERSLRSRSIGYGAQRNADLVPLIDSSAQAVFSLVEQHHGVVVGEMEEEITSVPASAETAELLGTASAGHGLQVTRRYRDQRGRLTQVSIGFYPAGRFVHHTKVQVQRGQMQVRPL